MVVLNQTQVETSAATDIGLRRTLNEDSMAITQSPEPELRDKGVVLVLADGLGGYNAGEVASNLVTSKLPEFYFAGSKGDCASDLAEAVKACNSVVHETSLISKELQGMGSTVVAAVIVNRYVIFANIGDSRGYLFRNRVTLHRTRDHSLNDAGMDVHGLGLRSRLSHVLTRAIGPKPEVLVDLTTHGIATGDIILLCSDGLTDCVTEEEIKHIVYTNPLMTASQYLVDLAKERKSTDNISVVLAAVTAVSVGELDDDAHRARSIKYLVL